MSHCIPYYASVATNMFGEEAFDFHKNLVSYACSDTPCEGDEKECLLEILSREDFSAQGEENSTEKRGARQRNQKATVDELPNASSYTYPSPLNAKTYFSNQYNYYSCRLPTDGSAAQAYTEIKSGAGESGDCRLGEPGEGPGSAEYNPIVFSNYLYGDRTKAQCEQQCDKFPWCDAIQMETKERYTVCGLVVNKDKWKSTLDESGEAWKFDDDSFGGLQEFKEFPTETFETFCAGHQYFGSGECQKRMDDANTLPFRGNVRAKSNYKCFSKKNTTAGGSNTAKGRTKCVSYTWGTPAGAYHEGGGIPSHLEGEKLVRAGYDNMSYKEREKDARALCEMQGGEFSIGACPSDYDKIRQSPGSMPSIPMSGNSELRLRNAKRACAEKRTSESCQGSTSCYWNAGIGRCIPQQDPIFSDVKGQFFAEHSAAATPEEKEAVREKFFDYHLVPMAMKLGTVKGACSKVWDTATNSYVNDPSNKCAKENCKTYISQWGNCMPKDYQGSDKGAYMTHVRSGHAGPWNCTACDDGVTDYFDVPLKECLKDDHEPVVRMSELQDQLKDGCIVRRMHNEYAGAVEPEAPSDPLVALSKFRLTKDMDTRGSCREDSDCAPSFTCKGATVGGYSQKFCRKEAQEDGCECKDSWSYNGETHSGCHGNGWCETKGECSEKPYDWGGSTGRTVSPRGASAKTRGRTTGRPIRGATVMVGAKPRANARKNRTIGGDQLEELLLQPKLGRRKKK